MPMPILIRFPRFAVVVTKRRDIISIIEMTAVLAEIVGIALRGAGGRKERADIAVDVRIGYDHSRSRSSVVDKSYSHTLPLRFIGESFFLLTENFFILLLGNLVKIFLAHTLGEKYLSAVNLTISEYLSFVCINSFKYFHILLLIQVI
jgi:hypothetical protein